jgi:chemotaxis protein MotB
MNKNREVPIRIIVRRKGHAEHHGGAWKVAFADFMTAMFALFLVLWIVNQSTDIKSAIAGYFQDPLGRADEFGSSILPGEGAQTSTARPLTPPDVVDIRRDRLRALAERLKERVGKVPDLAKVMDKVEIEITDDGLRVQLLEDSVGVFFETGRAAPSLRGREILALLGAELGTAPNSVRIEGYTDARPYPGTSTYTNWELSADRANMTRRILTQSGLPPSQVCQIRGLADRELRDPRDPFAACNRRITITLLLDDPALKADTLGAAERTRT